MDCKERELLVAYLDGETNDAEAKATSAHIEACPDCRKRLELLRRSYAALEAAEPVAVSAGFSARVRSRAQRRLLRMPLFVGTAVAAAAVVLLVFALHTNPTSPIAPVTTVAPVAPGVTPSQAARTVAADATPEELEVIDNMDILEDYDAISDLELLDEYDTLVALDELNEVADI